LRFLSGQHFWDVMSGLIAAAAVLSFGAWMVIKLIRAFEQSDAETARSEKDDPSS
jgi:flagellar biogenesis protein FliO